MANRGRQSKIAAIEGLDELLDQLDGLKDIAAGVGDAVNDAAKAVRRAIATEAPAPPGRSPKGHERTGALKSAIESHGYKRRAGRPIGAFVSVSGKKLAQAGRATNVGALVEFGTVKTPANPFFSRGWAKSKGEAERIVVEGVKRAIDEAL